MDPPTAKRKTASLLPAVVPPPPPLHIAPNQLEHLVALNYAVPETPGNAIALICTLGPSCDTIETLTEMIENGMTMARINMSYGTHDSHARDIKTLRRAVRRYAARVGYEVFVGIALDTKGPEIRLGNMDPRGPKHVPVFDGDQLSLTILPELADKGTAHVMYVDYDNIVNIVEPQDKIYLDDGYVTLVVDEVSGDTVKCTVAEGGVLSAYKNVIIADKEIDLPTIGERDKLDLRFAVEQELDFVMVSYMKEETILEEIRRILGERGKHIKLVSKIENGLGLRNFDAILEQSDGVMIMRAGLGIELDAARVMLAQKMIAAKCKRAWKPVIAATQLVVSMINSDRPKMVEVFDIGNTILDGVDGLMLSSATATGSHPVECVKLMRRVSEQTRSLNWARTSLRDLRRNMTRPSDNRSASLVAIMEAAINSEASAIVVVAPRARTANLLASFRPHCPIVVAVQSKVAARQCNIRAAIHSFAYKHGSFVDWSADTDEDRMDAAMEYSRKRGFIHGGKPVLIVYEAKLGYSVSMAILNTS